MLHEYFYSHCLHWQRTHPVPKNKEQLSNVIAMFRYNDMHSSVFGWETYLQWLLFWVLNWVIVIYICRFFCPVHGESQCVNGSLHPFKPDWKFDFTVLWIEISIPQKDFLVWLGIDMVKWNNLFLQPDQCVIIYFNLNVLLINTLLKALPVATVATGSLLSSLRNSEKSMVLWKTWYCMTFFTDYYCLSIFILWKHSRNLNKFSFFYVSNKSLLTKSITRVLLSKGMKRARVHSYCIRCCEVWGRGGSIDMVAYFDVVLSS